MSDKQQPVVDLREAKKLIHQQQIQIIKLTARLVANHLSACTAENCVLDGGPEHTLAFPEGGANDGQ